MWIVHEHSKCTSAIDKSGTMTAPQEIYQIIALEQAKQNPDYDAVLQLMIQHNLGRITHSMANPFDPRYCPPTALHMTPTDLPFW